MDEGEDKVVLLAVVQWDVNFQQKERFVSTTRTSKIRLRKSDLSFRNNAVICNGKDLLEHTTRILETEILKAPVPKGEETELKVDVYDDSQSAYVSLLDKGILEQDVTECFGTRLKINVRLTNNKNGPGSSQQGNIKAIKGRFYSYEASEGLIIAGSKISVKEMSNQQNTGTGVNLWDGSLLL